MGYDENLGFLVISGKSYQSQMFHSTRMTRIHADKDL